MKSQCSESVSLTSSPAIFLYQNVKSPETTESHEGLKAIQVLKSAMVTCDPRIERLDKVCGQEHLMSIKNSAPVEKHTLTLSDNSGGFFPAFTSPVNQAGIKA